MELRIRRLSGKTISVLFQPTFADVARKPSMPVWKSVRPRYCVGAIPIKKVRDIYIPDLHIDTLNLKARNFR